MPEAPTLTTQLVVQGSNAGLRTDAWLTLGIVALVLGLFLWNRLRADVVGLIGVALLVGLGIVTPQQGVSGFANEATVTVALMLILSAGLVRTGAVDAVTVRAAALMRGSETRLLVIVLLLVVPVSAFINNTAAVAVLLPAVLALASQGGIAPSRVLMPLSFGSQLGGTLTLIGTSTNLIVAGLLLNLGLPRIGLFEITPAALVLVAIGVVYLLTLGRMLTPYRRAGGDLLELYDLHMYVTALHVNPGSPLAGRSLAESRFGERFGLQVVRVERAQEAITAPRSGTVIHEGDILLVEGKVANIADVQQRAGLVISGAAHTLDLRGGGGNNVVEILIPPRSSFRGRSLRQVRLRSRFGISALGLRRHSEALHEPIGSLHLRAGDILLVQGPPENLRQLHADGDVSLIGVVDVRPKRRQRMYSAIAIMVAVVLLAATGVTTIMVSALFGTLAMFLTRCIDAEHAYEELDGQVLVLLAALIPLGIALEQTGAAAAIAELLVRIAVPLGPYGALGCLYLVTVALTSVVSNAATAVLFTPVALSMAHSLALSPMPFVIGVMFAASNSFATPIGYQTNLFIYGPGGYEFRDYLRVGGPLSLLLTAAATLVIPFFFPFER